MKVNQQTKWSIIEPDEKVLHKRILRNYQAAAIVLPSDVKFYLDNYVSEPFVQNNKVKYYEKPNYEFRFFIFCRRTQKHLQCKIMEVTLEEVASQLEDNANLIRKAQINHKKAPKGRLTLGYLKVRMQCVDEYWRAFKTGHQSLLKITKKEDRERLPYFIKNQYDLCEEEYLSLKTDLQDSIHSFAGTNTEHDTSTLSEKHTAGGSSSDVKLPRIDLPKFSGNYEAWQAFEDSFVSLIHKNNSLNNVQKLHYLKSCLTGEASVTLKHYQITDNNYMPAWDNLKERYSHKRLIVNAFLKRLFMQRRIQAQAPSQLKSFIDTTKECLIGLNNVGIVTTSWDPILLFLSMQKLDFNTCKEWEDHVSSTSSLQSELPLFKDLTKFLEGRIYTLELTASLSKPIKERTFHVTEATERLCICCNNNTHALYHCKDFGKLNPKDRSEFVRIQGLCFNCLLPGHSAFNCKLKMSCKLCGRRHHTLLHETGRRSFNNNGQEEKLNTSEIALHTNVEKEEEDNPLENTSIPEVEMLSHFTSKSSTSLLATALLPVRGESGQCTLLRALVDQGSQATFISERAAQLMKIKRSPVNGTITGVGSTKTKISHMVQLELGSRYDEKFKLKVQAYIMTTRLTTQLPTNSIPVDNWSHIEGIPLADPSFNQPGKIDMLLGVEVYAQIMKSEIIRGPPHTPCAQNTSLGWILFGKIDAQHKEDEFISLHCCDVMVDEMLKDMWELDTPNKRELTLEERLCEETYTTTHARTKDGKYIVKLPMKREQPLAAQGRTRDIALKRFHQLERQFERNSEFKKNYVKVVEEYMELNHIEEVPEKEKDNPAVYLPHHAVVREDKDTTKTRVVFDGSCKGTNNVSLNDDLLVGPTIQEDLRNLIMRWRLKLVCFVADIQKMYRAVLVKAEDTDYQRILWRSDPNKEVKDYRLLRVTFGTASAPFLAVRTLQQVSQDEGKDHPIEARIIKEDFYVDDLISGRDNVEDAVKSALKITEILRKGGFILQKWSSNDESFLKCLKPLQVNMESDIDIKTDGTIKTLGLTWDRIKDVLKYQIKLPPTTTKTTKRIILSEVQKLFDPLGFLVPALIPAKLIIQKLWLKGVTWDEDTDPETRREWLALKQGLERVNEIQINRWLHTTENLMSNVTIHGFCDASTKAYAAVAYLRVVSSSGEVHTGIIAAKARVAPIKPVSLPRLELCGAVILSRLLKQIQEATRIPATQIYAWTDSEIVLSWLSGDPARWNVFVSNRVVEIIDNIGNKRWYHVTSEDNPADVASRGQSIPELSQNQLWWSGPKWLQSKRIPLTNPKLKPTDVDKKKGLMTNVKLETSKMNQSIDLQNFDSLQEMLRVISYTVRFLHHNKESENIEKPHTAAELEDALDRITKIVQAREYEKEITTLKGNKRLSKESNLLSLNPILDHKGILRVGGRLRHANISERAKHPIILGPDNDLVPLLITDAHKRTLHGGLELTMNYLRSRFWIIKMKSQVRRQIHKCLICAKLRATNKCQIMGDLPKVRVTPARPFLHAGVDFAGPVCVLASRNRGSKCHKAYISLFICMATKAIHLELVSDLTSESFIGAFRRFTARRGKCSHIWSDHGKNFVGANRELADLWRKASLEIPGHLVHLLAEDGTEWHFIPPYSPNFGGLWEAGVKSVKHHLKRILNTNLTFEELTTTLCQIEACLNSRPLCPINDQNPETLDILTPGHFLIGEAPMNVPAPDLCDIQMNRLSRWQLTQKLVQDFWHRWQSEYLARLQERPKWKRLQTEFQVGEIILLKDENLPPSKWALGRIVEKHLGEDGVCRVYSVRCRCKVIKRSVSKLCKLPINNDCE